MLHTNHEAIVEAEAAVELRHNNRIGLTVVHVILIDRAVEHLNRIARKVAHPIRIIQKVLHKKPSAVAVAHQPNQKLAAKNGRDKS